MKDNVVMQLFNGFDDFDVVMSDITNQPFVTKDNTVLVYTDAYALENKLDYLRFSGYAVSTEPAPRNRQELIERLFLNGVETIVLNQSDDGEEPCACAVVELPFDGVIPEASADEDAPVVNPALTSALNNYFQLLGAGEAKAKDAENLFDQLRKARFVAPLNVMATEIKGVPVFPTIGSNGPIPLFADETMMREALDGGLSSDTVAPYPLTWDEVLAAIEQDGVTFSLNPNTVSLELNRETTGEPSALLAVIPEVFR